MKVGYVIREGDYNYTFLHDRVQEAAKSSLSEEQKKKMHLQIGLFLLDKINDPKQQEVR